LVITRLFGQGSNDSLEQMTCNATNQQAVQENRKEKRRPEKTKALTNGR
jgi:hydrogenase maturation factor HypF (carbamoyltransferase family)